MRRPVIYFLRHGETEWNAAAPPAGQSRHRAQSVRLRAGAPLWRGAARSVCSHGRDPNDLDYVSSPLRRARASMELVRTALGLDPNGYRTDPRLAEIAFGAWEGLSFADLKNRAAELLALREQDPWNFVPPGGESYVQLLARVRAIGTSEVTRDTVVASHAEHRPGFDGASRRSRRRRRVPRMQIAHAVVYVLDEDGITQHGASSHLTP